MWALALGVILSGASPPPRPQERARVEYVLVEVVARDRDQRLVTDLTLDDFALSDDGHPIRLESLDILDRREPQAPGPAPPQIVLPSPEPPRLRRQQVILAVDFEFCRYDEAMEAFDMLEKYLASTAQPAGTACLIYSLEGGAITDGFTSDLRAALPRLADDRRAYQERRREGKDDRSGEGDLLDLENRFRACQESSLDAVSLWNCVQEELAAYLDGQAVRTTTVLRELEDLVRRFPDPDALRSIAFVSPGFSARPGRAAAALARRYLPAGRPAVPPELIDPTGPRRAPAIAPEPRLESFEADLQALLGLCADHHVAFHTFDIFHFGLAERRRVDLRLGNTAEATLDTYRAFRDEVDEGLRALAGETGGAFHGGPSLKDLRPVLEGDRFVYVLGYPAPPGQHGKLHRIKVRCRRSGVVLAHRTSYVR